MNEFSYHRPASIEDAASLLHKEPEAKLLAGGQSLIPILKLGLAQPAALVTLRDVPGLRGIVVDKDELVVGAAATHADVASSSVVREAIPALAQLAAGIGDPQVR